MAVVTEPPWVNRTSGVAARNGTTTHTIAFGFTSTSGNELVVLVFGAVTHAAAGWTERLQPVNSGELSVFTKTSAGDTSITVTHNGSNYPACWAAYEMPAGSSWTAGTSSSPTSDTFPSLAGLPGVEQVVWAARGRAAGGASAGGSTWSAPWVEDADQFTPDASGTDGAYLTVGHQINVVAASVTPSAVTTYTGSWASPDREHVVFAFNVAASGGGGTTHTGAASGASTSAGSAAVTRTLAAAASGASTSGGSAAAGRLMAAATTGASSSSGTAAATIATGPATHPATASGASTSTGSAGVTSILAASASGASATTGTAAATVVGAGPVTHQAAASGSSTSAGSAAVTLRLAATAAGSSTTGGTASPGRLLAALASAAATSAGTALASIVGESVKATSSPTVTGGASAATVTARAVSVPTVVLVLVSAAAVAAHRASTPEVTHG